MGIFNLFANDDESAEHKQLMREQFNQSLQRDLASQAAYNDQGQLTREYLETLTEHGLDESTALLLRNMLSKDFVLGNLSNAQVHEAIWLVRVEYLKVKGQHPLPESTMAGEFRQFMFDDSSQGLKPLTPEQETLLSQAVMDIHTRVTRGYNMSQQDAFSKVVSEVRSVDETKDRDAGTGILGRR